MFEYTLPKRQQSSNEPAYLRRKKAFIKQIRQKDRENLINKLRKNAQLPDDLVKIVQSLPESIDDLIKLLSKKGIVEWQESIAYLILNGKQQLNTFFEVGENKVHKLPYFFLFLLKKGGEEVYLYNKCYQLVLSKSNTYKVPQRFDLMSIFNVMMKKGHQYILEDAQKFLKKIHINRFYHNQLRFYDTVLRCFPTNKNINTFLPPNILKMMSRQLGVFFYQPQERILMMEILIQILYLSSQNQVAKSFELEQMFDKLEYFFDYLNSNRMLIDRSILLIYNINIDVTSQIFVKHNCFKSITNQMKNNDNPRSIRSLMAELYLNSIYNYPQEQIYHYLTSNIVSIFMNLEYIVQEFGYQNQIKVMILELLRDILSLCAQENHSSGEDKLSNYLKSHSSFLKSLSSIKQAGFLLEQYHFMQPSEKL